MVASAPPLVLSADEPSNVPELIVASTFVACAGSLSIVASTFATVAFAAVTFAAVTFAGTLGTGFDEARLTCTDSLPIVASTLEGALGWEGTDWEGTGWEDLGLAGAIFPTATFGGSSAVTLMRNDFPQCRHFGL